MLSAPVILENPAITASSPAELYEAVAQHPPGGIVILDFDETLWLRKSTELFLDSVRPRFVAALVLQILSLLKPWRVMPADRRHHYRDWMRVLAVVIVAPWSLRAWRRKAADLGPRFLNRPLLEAVLAGHAGGTGVVTFGFRQLVEPLLQAIDPELRLLESCCLRHGVGLRLQGKAAAVRAHYGDEVLRGALIVTDSVVDADLLAASSRAFLVTWPDAVYEQGGLKPLMPFVYLQRVKRSDENYLRNAVLGHDLPVLLLAYAVASEHVALAAGAILLFVLGFFAAYETGYYENDKLGLILERQPKVSANFATLGSNFSPAFAWATAILLTGVASVLAYDSPSWVPEAVGLDGLGGFAAVWACFVAYLLAMRLCFRWQNVIAPKGRIVPMLGLQVGRVLGYAVILPTTVVGALLCVAHGVARWIPYAIYRFGGSRKDVPNHLNCLMLMVLLAGAVAIGSGWSAFLTWQSALIFAYLGVRAAKDLLAFGPAIMPLKARHGARPAEAQVPAPG
ncbi:MAG: HAD family hydrolase [Novosphingobium sp.]